MGKRIQTLRKQQEMTQEQLADLLGVTATAVSKWETNLSYPDITFVSISTVAAYQCGYITWISGKNDKRGMPGSSEGTRETVQQPQRKKQSGTAENF